MPNTSGMQNSKQSSSNERFAKLQGEMHHPVVV
jgi:hypothetical protein